jgi:hypothetical protein
MPAVFISYRREDSAGYAGRLHEELEERLGAQQVFRDVDTLRAGQDFEEAIRQRLSRCAACVVMIGPGWIRSQTATGERRLDQPGDYVVMEIAAALARPDVVVIPVLVGDAAMPGAGDLPDAIKGLARRHAFTARDETWEADMDRLAATLAQDDGTGRVPAPTHTPATLPGPTGPGLRTSRARYAVLSLMTAGAMVLALGWLFRSAAPATSSSGAAVETTTRDAGTTSEGPAYAIDMPSSGAEIAHGDLVYTPVAGSVQARGATTRVWLRMRVSNDGFSDANLWDDSFRLVVGNAVVTPNGGLNEILEKRSIRQVVIRFDVPSRPTKATLRVSYQGKNGEVPLDLTSNGRPAKHDETDEGDAYSRATFTPVARDEQPLVAGNGTSTSVARITNRHFANTQRLSMEVRWMNGGRYSIATGDLVLRLAAGGEILAPVKTPNEAVEGGATYRGDVIFDVAPGIREAVLKATLHGATRDLPLTLK